MCTSFRWDSEVTGRETNYYLACTIYRDMSTSFNSQNQIVGKISTL